MKKIAYCHVAILAVLLCISTADLTAQVNVTTYHNDNSRTGQNTQETILTTANVNSSQFGKLFSVSVQGYVYAQPLYLANVNIAGGTHNVLYVATEHDMLYAIDAASGTIYWQVSVVASGGTTVNSSSDLGCGDLVPEVGVTGTPVIDTSTGTIYLVAKSNVGGSLVQYLHAIDVVSAAEKFGGPVLIQASVPGTASDGNGTTVTF
jgi:outer membrane protein assembly factor BamB